MERNIELKDHSTLKVGGKANYFCIAKNDVDIEKSVIFAKENSLPIFILGEGSNMLFSDDFFPGLVLKIKTTGISYEDLGNGNFRLKARAGENWDDVVWGSVKNNLYGLENLSLIPGTVGAAPVQNIGAYGVEVSETIESVRVYDTLENKYRVFTNDECLFKYRDSFFKSAEGRSYVITDVSFLLKKNGQLKTAYKDIENYFLNKKEDLNLSSLRKAIVEIRQAKMPDWRILGTAGSFYKNPKVSALDFSRLKKLFPDLPGFPEGSGEVKIPIAWILDKVLNLKGFREQSVGLYENQPLVLVNYGGATSTEIKNFSDKISNLVYEKTKIVLEKEVIDIEKYFLKNN